MSLEAIQTAVNTVSGVAASAIMALSPDVLSVAQARRLVELHADWLRCELLEDHQRHKAGERREEAAVRCGA